MYTSSGIQEVRDIPLMFANDPWKTTKKTTVANYYHATPTLSGFYSSCVLSLRHDYLLARETTQ